MYNNVIDNLDIFNGLNMNPVPLEFGQEMDTTKWLCAIRAKLTTIINEVNGWYDTILKDLEGDGILYEKLVATFNAELSAMQTSINNLNDLVTLLEYTKPSLTLTTSANSYVYATGDTINSVMLEYTITKGSNNIVKVEIYKNGVLLDTINNPIVGLNNYVDGSVITSDTSYYIKLYDDKNNVTSDTIQFKFYYKAYYGKVADGVTINEQLVNGLNNVIFDDSFNFTLDTLSDEKIIIVSEYELSSIMDTEDYDIINSFTKSTVTMTINNNPVTFNTYVSSNTVLDSNVTLIVERGV